jgi:hypothetical protein
MEIASLLTNPIVVLIGLIGGVCSVIAIPMSVVLYFKSKKEKRPKFLFDSNNIIRGLSSAIPELKITYSGHGQPITNFTVTRFFFWNDGRETITKQDVARNDPLIVVIKEPYQILDATIIHATSGANNIDITLDREKRHIRLTFDYLDRSDGTVLQLIHNGTLHADLSFIGSIKGCGNPQRVHQKRNPIGCLAAITAVLLASAILLPYVLPAIAEKKPGDVPIRKAWEELLILITVSFSTGLVGILIGKWSEHRANRLLPKRLRAFTRHPLDRRFRSGGEADYATIPW